MSKVTVIVPSYNAERTLRRCIESLLNQTLEDIRVVIVDDGSSDGTACLADDFARHDGRVRVIHQQNQGCYMARMAGVAAVDTPFFGFVDSDDWVEPQMYERLHSFAESNELDIVECEINREGKASGRPPELFLGRDQVFQKVIYPRMWQGRGSNTVWSKLYRMRPDFPMFKGSFFSTWEDLICNLQFFLKANRFGYLHEGFYNYEITAGSSVRNFNKRNVEGLKETLRVRRVLAGQYGLSADDVALSQWTVRNVRNMFLSAVAAPAKSWSDRLMNTRLLLAVPELSDSMRTLIAQKSVDADAKFLRRICLLPLPLVIVVLRFAKLLARKMGRG